LGKIKALNKKIEVKKPNSSLSQEKKKEFAKKTQKFYWTLPRNLG
jgi:hypothetical protein